MGKAIDAPRNVSDFKDKNEGLATHTTSTAIGQKGPSLCCTMTTPRLRLGGFRRRWNGLAATPSSRTVQVDADWLTGISSFSKDCPLKIFDREEGSPIAWFVFNRFRIEPLAIAIAPSFPSTGAAGRLHFWRFLTAGVWRSL